jgi:hypothetical protein
MKLELTPEQLTLLKFSLRCTYHELQAWKQNEADNLKSFDGDDLDTGLSSICSNLDEALKKLHSLATKIETAK